jgi:hypothetical protein
MKHDLYEVFIFAQSILSSPSLKQLGEKSSEDFPNWANQLKAKVYSLDPSQIYKTYTLAKLSSDVTYTDYTKDSLDKGIKFYKNFEKTWGNNFYLVSFTVSNLGHPTNIGIRKLELSDNELESYRSLLTLESQNLNDVPYVNNKHF